MHIALHKVSGSILTISTVFVVATTLTNTITTNLHINKSNSYNKLILFMCLCMQCFVYELSHTSNKFYFRYLLASENSVHTSYSNPFEH